jgi:hypothetical protein
MKETSPKTNNDMFPLVEKKIEFFKDVIQKTIIHVYRNKFLDIFKHFDLFLFQKNDGIKKIR